MSPIKRSYFFETEEVFLRHGLELSVDWLPVVFAVVAGGCGCQREDLWGCGYTQFKLLWDIGCCLLGM